MVDRLPSVHSARVLQLVRGGKELALLALVAVTGVRVIQILMVV